MALIAGYGTYVVKKEKKNLKNEIQKCNCQKGEGECKHGNGCCGGHGDGQCKHGDGNGCCGGHGDGQCKHGDGQCKHGDGNGCCGGHGEGQCKHGQCKNKSSPSECIVGIME